MIAIVLTFDKYKAFSQHMIMCYQDLWPNNPFTFRIPYQSESIKDEYLTLFGDKVELVKSPSGIVDTVFTLIDDLKDEEIVFWCMDDRFPISLQVDELEKLHQVITNDEIKNLSAMLFTSSPYCWSSNNIWWSKYKLKNKNGQTYFRRKWYRMIWNHQYMRVDFIKDWFSHFPRVMKQAKIMDEILFKMDLPDKFHLYLTKENYGIYGESTSRGMIARNTINSLNKYGISLPEDFEICEMSKVQGDSQFYSNLWFEIKYELKRILRINRSKH